MGGVVKSERGQDDKDDEKLDVLSNGGVEGADDIVVVAGVNVRGWENVVSSILGADVVVKHHEFLLPFFLFFSACSFKPPDLLAALMAA